MSLPKPLNNNKTITFLVIIPLIVILPIILLSSSIPFIRFLAGIPFIFFLPGILFLVVLWPLNRGIEQIRRIALIIPSSVAIVGILLLVVNYFFVYQFKYVVVALLLLEIILAVAAVLRSPNKFPLRFDLSKTTNFPRSIILRTWKTGDIAQGVSILIFCASLTYAFITPRQQRELTEFYLLDPSSYLENQPYFLEQGEPLRVDAVVHSLESGIHEYQIEVWADNSPGYSERNLIHSFESFSLDEGEESKKSLSWFMPSVGNNQSAEILLYIDDEPEPYRRLLIWMDVIK